VKRNETWGWAIATAVVLGVAAVLLMGMCG